MGSTRLIAQLEAIQKQSIELLAKLIKSIDIHNELDSESGFDADDSNYYVSTESYGSQCGTVEVCIEFFNEAFDQYSTDQDELNEQMDNEHHAQLKAELAY